MSWQTELPVALSAAFHATAVVTLAARTALERRRPAPRSRSAVSILKPISGLDGELAENLASFAGLTHPDFELLLGFVSRVDPALPVARAFLAAHPELDARIVWTREPRGPRENPKVAQLIELARAAKHDVIVISDANVRVAPRWLEVLTAKLAEPGVGLATSVVAGPGGATLGADFDAAQLVACVAPAVVLADALGARPVAIGKAMAMRRSDLARLGGFEAVRGVLAEDDALAQRFAAAGFGVALSVSPVESRAGAVSLAATFDRHARWAKMRRAISPLCIALELLAMPALVAGVVFCLTPTARAFEVFVLALALQMFDAAIAAWALSRRRGFALWIGAIEPLRTVFHAACLLRAIASRRVTWRGRAFRLGPGSTLVLDARGGDADEPVADAVE